jgi:hypothetical protein
MTTERNDDRPQHTIEIYTAQDIAPKALRGLLARSRLKWVYAESLADTILADPKDVLQEESLLRWEHGRAFNETIEVDWWCTGTTFQLRLLTEGKVLEGIEWGEPCSQALQPVQDEPYPLRLHGTYDQRSSALCKRPVWSEARIPQPLAYPIEISEEHDAPDRVMLYAVDYARAGVVVLTRLVAVAGQGEELNIQDALCSDPPT